MMASRLRGREGKGGGGSSSKRKMHPDAVRNCRGEDVATHDDPGGARNNCSEANSSASRIFNISFSTSSREAAPIAVPSVFLR
jgi:hypothetical protein